MGRDLKSLGTTALEISNHEQPEITTTYISVGRYQLIIYFREEIYFKVDYCVDAGQYSSTYREERDKI